MFKINIYLVVHGAIPYPVMIKPVLVFSGQSRRHICYQITLPLLTLSAPSLDFVWAFASSFSPTNVVSTLSKSLYSLNLIYFVFIEKEK